MTGRERLTRVLNRQPVDRVCWTTLVDDLTRSPMPPEYREMPVLDFYRAIGCDILAFGNYGLPPEACVTSPCHIVRPSLELRTEVLSDGTLLQERVAPCGVLTATARSGHPVKYPVETAADLRTLTELWEETRYEEAPGTEESYARAEAALGEDGLYAYATNPSPVQELLEYEMGVRGFYYLLQDYPAEVEGLLEVMHARRLEEYEIVARRVPAPAIIPVENTSSTLISPALYRRYSLPQLRDYVRIIQSHGRKAVLHMCGHLRALLPDIGETGLDGLNAVTPPTVGDTPFELVLDTLGEDTVILGGVFAPTVFQAPTVSRDEIWRALAQTLTPRIRASNLLLWLAADGLATPVERFLWVREWMDLHGSVG